jgi:hypothetical protein
MPKGKHHTEEQIIGILKQLDGGVAMADICRQQISLTQPFISGSPSSEAWKYPTPGGSGLWRMRTVSSKHLLQI